MPFRGHPATRPPYGLPPLAPYLDPDAPGPDEWADPYPEAVAGPPVRNRHRDRPRSFVAAAWLQLLYLYLLTAFFLVASLPNDWIPTFFGVLIVIGSAVVALPWFRPGCT